MGFFGGDVNLMGTWRNPSKQDCSRTGCESPSYKNYRKVYLFEDLEFIFNT